MPAVAFDTVITNMQTPTSTNRISLASIDDVLQDCWVRLSQLRIFFGHQSVGYNIVDGMTDVMNEHAETDLNVAETCEPLRFAKPVLAHARVGRNTDPLSRMAHSSNSTS